jgi:hypothetical protein
MKGHRGFAVFLGQIFDTCIDAPRKAWRFPWKQGCDVENSRPIDLSRYANRLTLHSIHRLYLVASLDA